LVDMSVDTSPRIARLREDPGALEELWREVTAAGTPLIEPWGDDTYLVTFLWRGQAESTSVGWGLELSLTRHAGTDLWYGSQLLPADLRTIYYFRHDEVDGTHALPTDPDGVGLSHIDPHNPHVVKFFGDPEDPTDFDQWTSLLELPGAPDETWTRPREGVAKGSLLPLSIESAALGEARRVCAYLPAGVPTDGLPVLVVFDGYISRTVLRIPTALDNLIAAGRIPPLVALFVTSPNDRRDDELSPAPSILDFTTRELMPWARQRWRVSADPKDHVISGSSRGGLAAAYVALRAPDVFGAVISQSGSFWWPSPQEGEPEWLTREYERQPRVDVRFYLEVGDREDIAGPGGAPSQVVVNRRMRDVLRARGYAVTYAEYAGGHDYVNWRRTFADALIAILGKPGF
jgi:enterochelin esterase family protein